MSEKTDTGPGQLPMVEGSMYGATAYLTSYLATFLLVAIFEGKRFVGDLIEGAGWIFYNAQFVGIEQRAPPGSEGTVDVPSINYLTGTGLERVGTETIVLPAVVYHALPVLAFLGAGYFLTRSFGVTEIVTGAKVGGSIVFGIIFLSLGGAFIFEVADVLGPNRFQALALAGILYPVVCGATGGILSAWVESTR
ncbi:hypothetical protein ACFQJ7_05270 [Halovenus rubra]|uniref:DUF7978 domain-containing protein n=2 Tax=Halovenus rubra TaxID=869890 RepID=A0ABD5X2X1_9EURY|nr:hypothetical protein [Halovenus rubra]